MKFYLLVLLNWLAWPLGQSQFNLYNTDENLNGQNLQVNCLHHYMIQSITSFEKIEYCLGPIDNQSQLIDDSLHMRSENFTFDQLKRMNVTSNELFTWSSTIDLAERYQYYLDSSSRSEEIFLNCTKPWFGPRCQYSFILFEHPFWYIVDSVLTAQGYGLTNLTCYKHLKCNRGGSNLCLDWREICDGRIDCIDGGEDEIECLPLEINECSENEYRCHNGLCIPNEFLDDNYPQCLDKTDLLYSNTDTSEVSSIFLMFVNQEHACSLGNKRFTCGNGECVADFEPCQNHRHVYLFDSISMQGNLSYTCWMAMICRTKLFDQVNGTSCNQLLKSSILNTYFEL